MLGDGSRWMEIYELNKTAIDKANAGKTVSKYTVYSGASLKLPSKTTSTSTSKASSSSASSIFSKTVKSVVSAATTAAKGCYHEEAQQRHCQRSNHGRSRPPRRVASTVSGPVEQAENIHNKAGQQILCRQQDKEPAQVRKEGERNGDSRLVENPVRCSRGCFGTGGSSSSTK